uniref:ARF like GTPase 5B n=1 Tax=Ornithorhynchus anatinus TaxID=9258 RepID=A0A6I8NAE1_ORNAN
MGLLFAKLWSLFCNQEHKVIVVGLDNAGKTTILYQFLMNEVVHTSPTIGSNVEEIVVKNTHFLMWDIGGQESLRSSWNTYYSNTEFIILVVDSIDRERLSITREELYRMLAHEDLRKAAVLIFANKQDMKGCMSAAEISKSLTLSSIKDHPWHIQSCCALTGEGFKDGQRPNQDPGSLNGIGTVLSAGALIDCGRFCRSPSCPRGFGMGNFLHFSSGDSHTANNS